MTTGKNTKKKKKLRNNEYYDLQGMFDDLYDKSKRNYNFTKLLELITDDRNIQLAYRNIKRNKGSKTKGTNENTIVEIAENEPQKLVNYVKGRLSNYKPHPVRRVEIPKPTGGIRPLGIPTIEDRLIQQCILQILEPICEAKFYNHSYGFRPNRSAHHAISRAMTLANINKLHYVVDIDIKGFFDNVNHGKLLKQMWTLGIRDKRLVSIISKMLKAEIKGVGIPDKGTPQGGIISPLLSNIVLNELDWWIASQWENLKTRSKLVTNKKKPGGKIIIDKAPKYLALRKTNLKEMFIVRYADDFKIFCRDYDTAVKAFEATKQWLKERLGLDISPEKSKITNLNKNYTEFLGIRLKVVPKGEKYVVKSYMSYKAKEKVIKQFRSSIKRMQKSQLKTDVNKFNASILGRQQYYSVATHVSKDFAQIDFLVKKNLKNRTSKIRTKSGAITKAYTKFYSDHKGKKIFLLGQIIFPISLVKTKPPWNFSQEICDYTEEGRRLIHAQLNKINIRVLNYLMYNPVRDESIEYNDNRISLYCGQNGKCAITGRPLEIGDMEVHHKKPRELGGTDAYENLTFILKNCHKLIHATNTETIEKYFKLLNLNKKEIDKINKLRIKVGNCTI
ncbi:group II intron reverse transcriptase/maturase [uncultured Tissierella sp.]|uniref:group II intron reverse transcriptase/maturase n=1 Tax=uncultured Tissierella sp. TaxID=448160 RepID=UPI00280488EA|nr:group II intron reverse transcriptase/maturase [uncultured Tissierella sp.]MDU5082071.1 group II intron reverse transcriptase/maturase [Bacillota bacterium]